MHIYNPKCFGEPNTLVGMMLVYADHLVFRIRLWINEHTTVEALRRRKHRSWCDRCTICASQCISRVSKISSKIVSWCLRPVTPVYHF